MISNKKVNIKWGKDLLNLAVAATTVEELKKEIYSRTQVEPDRQKLLLKGKVLDNSTALSDIPEGSTLTLMGSAGTNISSESKKEVMFLEDMTPEQKVQMLREKGEEIVHGLSNLGNTCYFNSVVQCLGSVPELRQALKTNAASDFGSMDMGNTLARNMGGVYNNLDTAADAISPEQLLATVHHLNPMFAERDKGHLRQHDAEEFWSLVMNTLKDSLHNNTHDEKFSSKLIDELFGIQLETKMKNIEEPSEQRSGNDLVYKLPCFIDNQTTELVSGLKASTKENIEVFSEALQRNSFFERTQLINRLPPYLNIQFIRFFWKQENTMTGAKGGKAKILKSVMFSRIIDLYDMCSDSTKEILNIGRNIETKMLKEDKSFRIEKAPKEANMIPTGRFQLIAVVTHQGRSSESGHYIGWVHKKDDKWIKYDDDTVSTVKESDILELKGGGDWHMAYICIYKRLEVPFREITE